MNTIEKQKRLSMIRLAIRKSEKIRKEEKMFIDNLPPESDISPEIPEEYLKNGVRQI